MECHDSIASTTNCASFLVMVNFFLLTAPPFQLDMLVSHIAFFDLYAAGRIHFRANLFHSLE